MSLFPLDKSTFRYLDKRVRSLREAGQSPTLVHNLRTQPLTFALAGLGLATVLAAKVLVMRRRSREDGSTRGR